tara:strand:- start:7487 stop:8284 length:798 start_codon:yes stop_codon:yes gene_type:complete
MEKIIKWAGSKANVFDQFRPYLDFNRQYIEPFCGSAAFFFAGSPQSALMNDSNEKLINFYQQLQAQPDLVWSMYNSIPINEAQYYTTRDEFNKSVDDLESASKFLYLNHYSFNGIYRTNRSGNFNTPFGAKKKIKKKVTLSKVREASEQIQGVKFSSLDFEDFLNSVHPNGSTIYMDPPYHTTDARVFKEYGANVFSASDLERLAHSAKLLSKTNLVVISYRNCSDFIELFEEFIVGTVSVTRNVGGFAGRRKNEEECLAVLGGA